MSDWIKLHRRMIDGPINTNSQALHLWVNLLLITHWNKNPKRVQMTTGNGMKEITIRRGQCVFYKNEIANKMNVSKNTVVKYLDWLEYEEMIETIYSGRFTIVKIIKWEQYQGV